ncbi:MAG: tail fiber assembly protein [Bacillota bacterium]|nr:tail fiber assembly protein [Bacillota bacterium]
MPKVYHYSETGEYLGESEARESPLEPGVYLIPAHATDQAPPKPGPNQVPVFTNGAWTLVDIAVAKDLDAQPEDPPEVREAKAWAALRAMRDRLLRDSDWTQLPDVPLTAEAKVAWADYRQKLRDLPENTTDPFNPMWPVAPA